MTVVVWAATSVLGLEAGDARGNALQQADRVVIVKHERRLLLEREGSVVREFRIALGRNPVGAKLAEGDGRTPEGVYFIDNRNPESRFHLSLRISYPNQADIAAAQAHHVTPGSEIRIHGLPPDKRWLGRRHSRYDWTEGCIAVSSEEMDEIWQAVPLGTPVEIRP